MSEYVTILSLPYPQQIYIIKARLESEGIECFIKDELTIQTDPFLSNALGGIKLQVKEENVKEALKILDSEGYQRYKEDTTNPYQKLEGFANKLPFFKNVRFEVRLGILVVLVIIVVYLLAYFLTRPSPYKRLTESNWCVNYITYKDKEYVNHSLGLHLYLRSSCNENISFRNEQITLPGFNTYPINAQWEFVNDSVIIDHADTFQFVYNGRYSIGFDGENLVLKSKTTSINCTWLALF